jgi:hypothetical protein
MHITSSVPTSLIDVTSRTRVSLRCCCGSADFAPCACRTVATGGSRTKSPCSSDISSPAR